MMDISFKDDVTVVLLFDIHGYMYRRAFSKIPPLLLSKHIPPPAGSLYSPPLPFLYF
jgi:hypothetical protein